MTPDELKTVLRNFLDGEGRLKLYPAKVKMKLYALGYLATKFAPGETYSESDVNGTINRWHLFGDVSTLRRDLCDYRFMARERDGSAYWLNGEQPDMETLIAAIK